ncbi:MAG: hypothetical protein K6D94_13125, partial [Clostridiales bacterium]|nr:hypothetical protein [Clostridiales bacterium]
KDVFRAINKRKEYYYAEENSDGAEEKLYISDDPHIPHEREGGRSDIRAEEADSGRDVDDLSIA